MNDSKNKAKKTIALNKRARFEYYIEERFEAGIALEGWEVKALRDGRIQFADSYVLLKDNEAFLFGCLINPLPMASRHTTPDPHRKPQSLTGDKAVAGGKRCHNATHSYFTHFNRISPWFCPCCGPVDS